MEEEDAHRHRGDGGGGISNESDANNIATAISMIMEPRRPLPH